ncbi:unnamed protein product [Rhizophagus irregularis]|nr:unnamed protein product [Rhizophagus irregularis]
MSKSTWILIFTKVQLILDELFMIFTTVLIHEFYFFHFVTSERILSTLAKANRLHLLIEYCSACQNLLNINFHEVVQHVKIYLDINFYEERILSTLAKANRLHLLIENCSAA